MPLFSLPDDAARTLALVAALAALLLVPLWLRERARRRWLDRLPWLLAPLSAALLSHAYIAHYLRGGPRIIDASAYWLQARALSKGMFAFPIGEPEHAVLGRFLLRTTVDGDAAASVIFPPGYPALLSLGFRLGVPMLVGPALAAAITVATMMLMRRVVRAGPMRWQRHEQLLVGLTAVISVSCATLRYHTADTMSHGLAALCVTVALCAWLGPQSGWQRGWAPALGFAAGLLFATRPASAMALTLAIGIHAASSSRARATLDLKALAGCAIAAAPPIALWLVHQHTATGSFGSTAQGAYYALSDGPPGCFRYGFGAGIGCLGEHGEFVRNSVGESYGAIAAIGTTGRRLKMHLADALNFAPLFPLVVVGAAASWSVASARVLSLIVLAQIACYAPFYFDGNYPGGGARMYADVLPAEQLLAVLAILLVAARRRRAVWLGATTIALGLAGFALNSGVYHQQLRERDGGSPMFDPSVVTGAGRDALLLLDTDHGFNLAYAPGEHSVARHHGDALDRLAWEQRGRPATFRFARAHEGEAARLQPVTFDERPSAELPLTIEAESLWPPAHQRAGWAWPSFVGHDCASAGRVLALYPTSAAAELWVRLPAGLAGRTLTLRAVPGLDRDAGNTSVKIAIYQDGAALKRWQVASATSPTCLDLAAVELPNEERELTLEVRSNGPFAIDSLMLSQKR